MKRSPMKYDCKFSQVDVHVNSIYSNQSRVWTCQGCLATLDVWRQCHVWKLFDVLLKLWKQILSKICDGRQNHRRGHQSEPLCVGFLGYSCICDVDIATIWDCRLEFQESHLLVRPAVSEISVASWRLCLIPLMPLCERKSPSRSSNCSAIFLLTNFKHVQ